MIADVTYSIIVQYLMFKHKTSCIFAISIYTYNSILLQQSSHLQVNEIYYILFTYQEDFESKV